MTTHLRPTAATAPSALLPGDPKRAMDLAAKVMERPLMSNLSRGLWGYWGCDAGGRELTIQSTGIGGPSAAAVLGELSELGVTRAIRVGTCVAIDARLRPGDELVVNAALAGDGIGAALGLPGPLLPDAGLTHALGGHGHVVASLDLMPEPRSAAAADWASKGAVAIDLSTAAVLAMAGRLGLAVGCALVVSASWAGEILDHDPLDEACLALGEKAAVALFEAAPQPAV